MPSSCSWKSKTRYILISPLFQTHTEPPKEDYYFMILKCILSKCCVLWYIVPEHVVHGAKTCLKVFGSWCFHFAERDVFVCR